MRTALADVSRDLAAEVNPPTVVDTRTAHREEVADLRKQLRDAKQLNLDVDESLLTAVVTLDDGETYTLHQLWEDAWTETFKRTRPRCPKCPPSADIHDAEAHS